MESQDTDPHAPNAFEQKKRDFFRRLALSLRPTLNIHKALGLWKADNRDRHGFRNVTEHCLVEVPRCRVLAEHLRLPDAVRKKLDEAAILHDAWKQQEILLARQASEQGTSIWAAFARASEEFRAFLVEQHVDPDVIELTGGIGHLSLKTVESLLEKHCTPLEEAMLILHYVDDISRNSDWVAPATIQSATQQKVNALDLRMDACKERPLYRQLDIEGNAHLGEGTYAAVLRVGHAVEAKLSHLIRLKSGKSIPPVNLPEWIDTEVRTAIETGSE
ncbi:hypothetical protein COU80_00230 [Candidatus Peregrinibacteria bacterium CG10_big_fil_rev_8_21_14_0_10_55_24]|nr:MAG: hypothetical protein COU80_00230 [Candidatus Peregrinibacteria bacterium CG10_big_fil_rev_8_21_14_0_10_55_24]